MNAVDLWTYHAWRLVGHKVDVERDRKGLHAQMMGGGERLIANVGDMGSASITAVDRHLLRSDDEQAWVDAQIGDMLRYYADMRDGYGNRLLEVM